MPRRRVSRLVAVVQIAWAASEARAWLAVGSVSVRIRENDHEPDAHLNVLLKFRGGLSSSFRGRWLP